MISMKIDMENLATYVKNIDVCLSIYNTDIGTLDKVDNYCCYCNCIIIFYICFFEF